MQNFVEAVRSRDPNHIHAEIEQTFLSTALCHLGIEADALLTRRYRAPYVVPERV
jgi:hypothetical protein